MSTPRDEPATGYEHLTGGEFWAEVAHLLTLVAPGGLADYVHAEARRRDSELAANYQQRLAMIETADARTPFDPMTTCIPFTPEEDAAFDGLYAAYRERFTALAARDSAQAGSKPMQESAPLPAGWAEWTSPEGVSHAVPPAGPCATCGTGRHGRLQWHPGKHGWGRHDGYPVHLHGESGLVITPAGPSLRFAGHGQEIPEDHRYLLLAAPREEPAGHAYILRQTRTRETAFHLVETAPDGTEKIVLATLPDGIAVDVLEAVRAAYAHGCDDTNERG